MVNTFYIEEEGKKAVKAKVEALKGKTLEIKALFDKIVAKIGEEQVFEHLCSSVTGVVKRNWEITQRYFITEDDLRRELRFLKDKFRNKEAEILPSFR
ncbi:MAG: hypothetical protein NT111_02990 [Patescibacteria group bacterium]|nr:hypothetical protein [Patescibacteria group bacterium]